ncbi:tRNA (32-2'-O)-methyltransferase regulator THADA-like [Macrobrachium rosenbergii]|uniref:tRNA (32-2'-O)-methyltransferase regulator THADA-like n=1 Tax=Macrobrachium rosenbergii TaxID=79674 RepID=UPI0034D52C0F
MKMEEGVSVILDQLFSKSVDQRTIRNLKKTIDDLQPPALSLLVSEVVQKLGQCLRDDSVAALSYVCLFSSGCQLLQQCVTDCLPDIINSCISGMQPDVMKNDTSRYHISSKAVYGVLQIVSSKCDAPSENYPPSLLHQLLELLVFAVADENLPSDCALIIGTSLCLAFTTLVKDDRPRKFYHLLKVIESYDRHHDKEMARASLAKLHILWDDEICLSVDDFRVSFPIVITVHGLLNCGVYWLYSIENCRKQALTHELLNENVEGCCKCSSEECACDSRTGSHCVRICENEEPLLKEHTRSEAPPSMKCNKGTMKGDKDCESANVFLYGLGSLINKICRAPSSYSFQAFQVLLSWLQNVRKMIRMYKEDCGHQKLPDLCIYPSKLVLFAFHSENTSSVFHLLNSNWESPSKGVSDTVYSCMTELLHLHEEESPGQAKTLSLQMVSNLVCVDAWNLKSTYPPLALAMSFVGAEMVLQKYPSIPEGLYKSLMVNYLAPAGANVYKIIVKDVSSAFWSKCFIEVIMKALQSSDRVTRQNVLTLWLPITIRQYPDVCITLLDKCVQSSSEGWLARVAVLKVARSCGSMDIEENMELCISTKEENEETLLEDMSNEGKKCDVESKPFSLVVRHAINHIDEMVRSEALAFLCHTKKASQPVTHFESKLLKEFFSLNVNVDSAPFRQNVIRCYKALVVRLRDSCAAVLKAPPYKNLLSKEKFADHDFKNLPVNSTLYINGELLLWFLSKFHSNFLPGSNYQRRILSLQLYKETLLAFFEADSGSAFTVSQRFTSVCSFVNSLSKIVQSNMNDASKSVIDLALPWTYESLLLCSLDEMDDIRDEVENIFRILEYSKMKPQEEEVGRWLLLGLSLCNSPKTSDVESGASIVKIISSHHNLDIPSFLEEYGGFKKSGSSLSFLYDRVEAQFRGAQRNILTAAREAPIHGSLLALGRYLCEADGRIAESSEYLQKLLKRLLELMVEMIEFMLSILAISSKNGSAIAPSFAEMGESIEMMIRRCENNTEGAVQEATEETKAAGSELLPDSSGEDGDETYESETAISSDHALILACCWQTMKVCCLVSSNCTSRWTELLTEDQIEMILRSIIIRVLTGTRHKGAMEAARTCYSQLCVLLLSPNSKLCHLIYRQIDDILDHLKAGAQTSVTRRAAGMAMMVQVACGAVPRNNRVLIDSTVMRLMDIIETEYEEQNTVDSPPVLALHILHSLVIHASLAHHLIQHMPSITMTCLKAFTSNSWALRNAALQLYGAVVPRMVGQKKVRDDSSILNSLTASEFLARHAALADFLLQLLENNKNTRNSQINQDSSTCLKDLKDNEDFNNQTFSPSLAEHSNLVPVLSLLARLSPGTGLQQSLELNERLSKYYSVTILLLGSQIHTVRRLSALSLVALTPSEQAVVMVKRIISSLTNERLSANEVHGKLLTIIEFLDTYPNLATDDSVRVPLVSLMVMILKSASAYYVIASTALKILKTLKFENLDINLDSTDVCKPGAPQFVLTATKLKIMQLSEEEKEKFVLKLILYNQVLEEYYLTFLESFIENSRSERWMERVEMTIWQKLEDSENLRSSVLVRILYVILKKQNRITQIPSKKCMENLLILLQGFSGAKIASKVLTVFAFVIKYLCSVEQFDSIVMCEVVNEFSSVVCKYSNATSTEDYRLEASTALTIAFPPLFLSQLCIGISPKEQLIVAVLDLLQDEDPVIRDASCHIVFQLQKYSLPYLISLNPLTFLKNQIQELVLPNLALSYFIEIVVMCSLYQNNWKVLQVIWRLLYEDIACEYKPKLTLFQSQAVNLYKEQKHCGTKIREAFEGIVREYVATRNTQNDELLANDGISEWVLAEYEEIQKQCKKIQTSLKQHEDRLTDRRFLLAEVMCIKAQETLLSVSSILDIKLDFDSGYSLPIQEGKYFWLKL